MSKVNLRNMPCGQLYEYSNGLYVWKISRAHATRSGNYLSQDPSPSICTEVFRIENDGRLGIVWSGELMTNPEIFNEECLDHRGCFSIFSYDQDTSSSFQQNQELKIAPIELQIKALKSEIEVLEYIDTKLKASSSKRY